MDKTFFKVGDIFAVKYDPKRIIDKNSFVVFSGIYYEKDSKFGGIRLRKIEKINTDGRLIANGGGFHPDSCILIYKNIDQKIYDR